MENIPRSNNNPENKSKIVSFEAQGYIEKNKLIKDETEKEIKVIFNKLKENIDLLDSELDSNNIYYEGNKVCLESSENNNEPQDNLDNHIMEIQKSIKNLNEHLTELDLDKIFIDDELAELKMLEKLFKDKLLIINKNQLN